MNTQKRVFKKLAEETKVELSAQKVELGVPEALNYFKTDAKSKVNSAANEIANGIKELDKVLVKMKNAEKDLGIDLSNEINSIKKTDSKAREALKKAQSLISDLSSI
jgi:hypothetical protein